MSTNSLKFVVGPSGSGKTEILHQLILRGATDNPNQNYIILVPEQFNMQTQRDIVMKSPNKGILNIDVLSFARLAHRIFDEAGGNNRRILDDLGKSLILRRVASIKGSELKILSGNINKTGYVQEIKSVISEFLQYDIMPEDLKKLATGNENRKHFASKLQDLAVIYQGFIDQLGESFITMEEVLDHATRLCERAPFLNNAEIFLDGFTGFTPVQIRFLGELLKRCKGVTITITLGRELLCDDIVSYARPAEESELFALSKNTIYQMNKIAKALNIKAESIVTNVSQCENALFRFQNSPELACLEHNIFRPVTDKNVYKNICKDVSITRTLDIHQEVKNVCHQIQLLVRNEGYKYGDIAIICGDLQDYEHILMTEMVKQNIPSFCDSRHKILLNPFTEYITSIFDILLSDFSYESVFRYLRSSLTEFTNEEIDELDNYIIAAGIKRRSGYMKTWVYKYKGVDDEKLLFLNNIRARFVDQLETLFTRLPRRKAMIASEYVSTIYEFIRAQEIYKKLSAMSKEFETTGDITRADEYKQVYRSFITLLDRVMELLQDEPLTLQEFKDICEAGFEELSVGVLPPGIDVVVVGDMERSRLSEVKALFFMGVNDGYVPRDIHKRGILSELDRQFLKEQEVELAPDTRAQAFIQRFYLYMYLTKPTHKLYLSYSSVGEDGVARMPSYVIGEISRMFPELKGKIYEDLINTNDLLSMQEGFDFLVTNMKNNSLQSDYMELFSYFAKDSKYSEDLLEIVENAFSVRLDDPIKSSVAYALYGSIIKGGVTRLEKFASCAYAHFLQYGLRLLPKEEFSFEAKDLGTLYHKALENFGVILLKEGISWLDINSNKAQEIMDSAVTMMLNELKDSALYGSFRDAYMEERIRRILSRTIDVLTYQLQKGDFIPGNYEITFAQETDIGAIDFEYPNKNFGIQLYGKIDRMDTYADGDITLIKVIDYKSGNNDLKLAAVYAGTSLQLITYLGAAMDMQSRKNRDKRIKPAGVLYYHIDDPIIERNELDAVSDINQLIRARLKMTGLVSSDNNAAFHMDKELEKASDVIPVELKKDGDYAKRSKVITDEEFSLIIDFTKKKIEELAGEILSGNIARAPMVSGKGSSERSACDYCKYKGICRYDSAVNNCKPKRMLEVEDSVIIDIMRNEMSGE